jgi:lipoprotein-anchoring transpeptidase ErfK/SrfK
MSPDQQRLRQYVGRIERMDTTRLTLIRRTLGVTALAVLCGTTGVEAQSQALALSSAEVAVPLKGEENALDRGRYAIVVDLDENRLYFKQGELTLWSAPVGTGTGMRVITENDDWDFSTPTGRFQVQYKERNPVWIAPDWYFVENNLPVPPTNHPSRYFEGTLGAAAIYISPHLAIHGTDRPELIGQRVSHGCIRLENRYAMRLYHNVQVGTEVIIVGGEEVKEEARVVDLRNGYDPSLASRGGRRAPQADRILEGWTRLRTPALLERLDEQLAAEPHLTRWDEIAILLLQRAREDDDAALEGLLARAGDLPSVVVEREWATYLTDAYRRAPVRMLEALANLDLRHRRFTAGLIVSAAVTLYNGDLDAPSVPWPTHRIPRDLVSREGQRGWDALHSAEREHRTRLGALATQT